MRNDGHVLEFTLKEELPQGTSIYQIDDGTVFYWSSNTASGKRLYVKSKGKEIEAVLPGDRCFCLGAYGNALYLSSNEKIYKAVLETQDGSSYVSMFYNLLFAPQERIAVSFVRDELMDESLTWSGTRSRVIDDKECVYRACDNPEKDCIHVDIPAETVTKGLALRCIHRDKAVYASEQCDSNRSSVREVGRNVIVIEASDKFILLYANDCSPFLYLVENSTLHTIDTDTMEFLPELEIDLNRLIISIVGMQERTITVQCKGETGGYFMATAELPRGYFKNVALIDELKANMQLMSLRTSEIERKLKEVCNRNAELEMQNKQNEKMKIEMSETINELRNQSITSLENTDQNMTVKAEIDPSENIDLISSPVPTDPIMSPPISLRSPPPAPPPPPSLITSKPSEKLVSLVRKQTVTPYIQQDAQSSILAEIQERHKMRKKNAPDSTESTIAPSAPVLLSSLSRRVPPPIPPKPLTNVVAFYSPVRQTIDVVPSTLTHEEVCEGCCDDDLPPPPPHVLASLTLNNTMMGELPQEFEPPESTPLQSAPPPPPPPPPPLLQTVVSHEDKTEKPNDTRANLLADIQAGCKLRKVTIETTTKGSDLERILKDGLANIRQQTGDSEDERDDDSKSWADSK